MTGTRRCLSTVVTSGYHSFTLVEEVPAPRSWFAILKTLRSLGHTTHPIPLLRCRRCQQSESATTRVVCGRRHLDRSVFGIQLLLGCTGGSRHRDGVSEHFSTRLYFATSKYSLGEIQAL